MRAPSFRIPLRFLRARDGRTTLTVVAIALGIALVCALDLVSRSLQLAFDEIVDTMAGRTALEVSAGDGGLVPEDLAAQIEGVAGVELAAPVVRATAFATDGGGDGLAVQGVDLLNEHARRIYEARDASGELIDDPVRFLANPRAAIFTRTFATRRGLEVGGSIELDTPRGRRSVSVLHLLEPEGIARVDGGNLMVMEITIVMVTHSTVGTTYGHRTIELNDGSVVRDLESPVRPGLRLVSDPEPS